MMPGPAWTICSAAVSDTGIVVNSGSQCPRFKITSRTFYLVEQRGFEPLTSWLQTRLTQSIRVVAAGRWSETALLGRCRAWTLLHRLLHTTPHP
jgi:hypothetical protein